jgi:hypothetical protein
MSGGEARGICGDERERDNRGHGKRGVRGYYHHFLGEGWTPTAVELFLWGREGKGKVFLDDVGDDVGIRNEIDLARTRRRASLVQLI